MCSKKIVLAALFTLVFTGACKKKSDTENNETKGAAAPQAMKKVGPKAATKSAPAKVPVAAPKLSASLTVHSVKGTTLKLERSVPNETLGVLKSVQARDGRLYGIRARKPFGSLFLDASGTRKELKGVPRPLAFSPDGARLAVVDGGQIHILNWTNLAEVARLAVLPDKKKKAQGPSIETNIFVSVAFSPDGKLIATGEINFGKLDTNHVQTLSIWDAVTFKRLFSHREEEVDVNVCDVAFTKDGKHVAMVLVGGPGKGGSYTRRFTLEAANLVSSDGRFAALKEVNFDIPCEACIDSWQLMRGVYAVSYSMKLDGVVNLYRISDGAQLKSITFKKRAESDSVRRFALSADGSLLAFGICAETKWGEDEFGNDQMDQIPYEFVVLEAKGWSEKTRLAAQALTFHPRSPLVAYVAAGELRLAATTDLTKSLATAKVEGVPHALRFSADGLSVVLNSDKGTYLFSVK